MPCPFQETGDCDKIQKCVPSTGIARYIAGNIRGEGVMKVLMINGSPEKNSCTGRALAEIAETLKHAGIDSEIIQIGREVIRGCVACRGCYTIGKCTFDDIVNDVAAKLEDIDAFIVGSPVYYASGNGTLYAFLDRLFFSASRKLRYKPAAAVVVARRAGTTATFDTLNKYFTINEMPVVSSSYWNMVHGFTPADVEKDLEGLQTMRNIAHNMAWLLKCIEAGKQAGIALPASERGAATHFIMPA